MAETEAVHETGRVEAFSDGVLAIAITLLVLELPVPSRDVGSLTRALLSEWPSFAAYLTSFLVIGIIWINHRSVFRLIGRVDRTLLFSNLVLLLFVATIPFTTALFAEFLTEGGGNARTSAVCYSAVMLGMSVAFSVLYVWVTRHPALLAERVDQAVAQRSIRRFVVGVLVYGITVVIALFNAVACLALHFALAMYYSFEQTRGSSAR